MHHLRKEEEQNLTTADIAERNERGPRLVDEEKAGNKAPARNAGELRDERQIALFPDKEVRDMRSRWDKIQTGFVDEPRQAVKQADELVASAMKRIAEQFSQERSELEKQWDRGDNVSTEDLRLALQRYRAFFDRLLSV